MLSFPAYNTNAPPRQPSPLPRRTDSLSSSIAKPKPTSPLVQSKEDVKFARVVLGTPITALEDVGVDEEERERRREDRERELIEMLGRMTGWVEELTALLQQAYKNQTDLETALTLTRSNLQLALANNEMLEEALKRGGGKDVGWRRWSEREGVRRSSSVKDYVQHDRPNSVAEVPHQPPPPLPQQQQQQSAPSRFFNFKSPLQRISSNNTSPTSQTPANSISPPYSHSASASTPSLLPSINIPSSSRSPSPAPGYARITPSTPATDSASSSRTSSPTSPTEREKELGAMLEKERLACKAVLSEKAQLEDELESLSQALFEEANKMVSKANRKLAETEEELRIAMEQKEALKGALRIVEGENGTLRGRSTPVPGEMEGEGERGRQRSTVAEEVKLRGVDNEAIARDVKARDAADEVKTRARQEQATHPPAPPRPPSPSHTLSRSRSRSPQPHADSIPAVTVTMSTSDALEPAESFWSPVTPRSASDSGSDTPLASALSPHAASPSPTTPSLSNAKGHRWSMLPKTPRSRNAVRSEFEQAMRRMQDLVGDDVEVGEEEEADTEQDGQEPGKESNGARPGSRTASEAEVEAEVVPRDANPWTS